MDQDFQGLAEAQATLYFQDILGWVKDLDDARKSVCRAFSLLIREYQDLFPRCTLQLFPNRNPCHGPTRLYWGKIRKVLIRTASGIPVRANVVRYMKGQFRAGWVYTVARRSEFSRFVDFDRRRQALNVASRATIKAFNHLRVVTSGVRRFPPLPRTIPSSLDPEQPREVPGIPQSAALAGLPPELVHYLRFGWLRAFTLAVAEEECCRLALEVAGNPSAEGLRLELGEREPSRYARSIRWIHLPTGESFPRLMHSSMIRMNLRKGVRPVLRLKELKRLRISGSLKDSARRLAALRDRSEETQHSVSKALAEAGIILIPVSKKEVSPVPAAI